MIKNGKYFHPLPERSMGLKELFRHFCDTGTGRPANASGSAESAWTPDLLLEAISTSSADAESPELRTVQHWFHDNDRSISTANIHLLSRIFGCDDPVLTVDVRRALLAAQHRLKTKRRASCRTTATTKERQESAPQCNFLMPRLMDSLFARQHPLTLPVVVWTGCAALAIVTFIFGVDSVTYEAREGLNKQVGFLWAPSWTILPIVILPLFLYIVTGVVNAWHQRHQPRLSQVANDDHPDQQWPRKLLAFKHTFWSIFVLSYGLLFLLQWTGIHLRALLSGDASGYMIDWNIISLMRPDVVSNSAEIFVSLLAYAFFSTLMWLLFGGLVFLIVVTSAFHDICSSKELSASAAGRDAANASAVELIKSVYRCVVLSILFATLIKLQSTYLMSSGETIYHWLANDTAFFLGLSEQAPYRLNTRGIPQFTTALLLLVSCAVFFVCSRHVALSLQGTASPAVARPWYRKLRQIHLPDGPNIPWGAMIAVIVLMSLALLSIGLVNGFSCLVGLSTFVAAMSLYDPAFEPMRPKLHERSTLSP